MVTDEPVAHHSDDKRINCGMMIAGENRRRFIYNTWLRDPNGRVIKSIDGIPDIPPGKRHPSGLLWGDDLDSFFTTCRIPDTPHFVSYCSRSMIQEFGENFYKLPQIDEEEPDPVLLNPYPMLLVHEWPTEPDADSDDEYFEGLKVVYMPIPLNPGAWLSLCVSAMADEKESGLPKLEEFIPDVYFPDVLIVHDHGDLLRGRKKKSDNRQGASVEYRRIWPVFERDHTEGDLYSLGRDVSKHSAGWRNRIGHLQLSAKRLIGEGHHSLVYQAPIKLPDGLCGPTHSGQVTVAAKLAKPWKEAREMLRNEAWIYNKFPKHLMEDWSGYVLVKPHKFPVPADAVVPKFYGYYVPYSIDPRFSAHPIKDLSPILLLEECGKPVEPSNLSMDERSQCYTHVLRLHTAGFMQNSIYMRNVVMQPGPLCVLPSERSMACPAFRIIDFGRGEWVEKWFQDRYGKCTSEILDDNEARGKLFEWHRQQEFQEAAAINELGLGHDSWICS